MKFDVIMLTWNSEKPWFKKCLKSIKAENFVNKLIVVDKYSRDGTIEIIKEIFPDATIIRCNYGLAKSRWIGIQHADTEYIAFIDSDIQLLPGWGKIMTSILKEYASIAGVHGKDVYVNPYLFKYEQAERKILGKLLNYYRRVKKHNYVKFISLETLSREKVRGLTHNTIVLREALKDWKPPKILSIGEDHHLMLHVLEKGLYWGVVEKPVALHYAFKNLKETYGRGIIEGASTRILAYYKIIPPKYLWAPTTLSKWIKVSSIVALKALFISLMTKEAMFFPYKMLFYLGSITGYLSHTKYIDKVMDLQKN